jgi:hypothetical protein
MKKLILVILLFLTVNTYAQHPVEIGPNTTGTVLISLPQPGQSVPYNYNSRSVHIQFVYTAAEMFAGGAISSSSIDSIGWYVLSQIDSALTGYTIKMKNTTASNVATYDGAGLTTVYNHDLPPGVDTGWYMIPFDAPFYWDGTSNILVDVCWGFNSGNSQSGTMKLFSTSTSNDERIFIKSNSVPTCSTAPANAQAYKPFVRFNTCNSYSQNINQSICAGQSFSFNGQNLTQPGTYSATFQTVNGCDSVINLTLSVQYVNTSVGVSQGTLTASAPNVTVQWVNCSNNYSLISGATTSSYTPTVSGSYAAIITTTAGCADTTACLNVTAAGLNEFDLNGFAVYPNPTSDVISIVAPQSYLNLPFELLDAKGNLIKKGVYSNDLKIDVSALKNGLYMLYINNKAVKFTKQ